MKAKTFWKPFVFTYMQHKSVSKGEGVRFSRKIILLENNLFCIDYQENTTAVYYNLKLWVGTIYGLITGTLL